MCEIVDLQAIWQEMRVVWEYPLTLNVYNDQSFWHEKRGYVNNVTP